ncbi:MAG: CDP-diacylglycerol--glycerol-3-phosphate 3-phosphatidyltransferase [Clostridiales bacterium]|nr:CDP-diacylglycerol--glycerol-3-phosphate 3-phosphatidyltransferase [Clostridiales bacterium]
MNLPNKLSMLRVCMIPVFMAFALRPEPWAQYAAVGVFALASLTDMLDGQIARRRNLITDFGKFIDPIADKLLVMAAQVALVGQGRMPSWICVLMLAREFAVSGFRLVAAGTGNVIAAGWLGKIKTVTQMASVILLFLLTPVAAEEPLLGQPGVILAQTVTYIAAAMTVLSGAEYIIRNFDCIRDM